MSVATILDSRWTRRLILSAFVVTSAAATGVCGVVKECNNFHTFRWAFHNLLAGANLYVLHPGQHEDLFKYSPTFALLFAPFAALPFAPALLAWNLLNALLLYAAVSRLLPDRRGVVALSLLYAGYLLTLDGTQSNGLIAALIIGTFIALERQRIVAATVAIAGGALIKLFPIAALLFAVPHRGRRRFGATFAVAAATLVALPLMVISPTELLDQYRSWWALEEVDASDRGASLMSLLQLGFGYSYHNLPIQIAGTILLLAPLARISQWSDSVFRVRMLASLLVYSVIFNHKAEQPTFIVALAGIAIWYAVSPRDRLRDLLVAASLLLMVPVFVTAVAGHIVPSLAPLTLPALRIAAVPCAVAWFAIQAQLLGLAWTPATELRLSSTVTRPQTTGAD